MLSEHELLTALRRRDGDAFTLLFETYSASAPFRPRDGNAYLTSFKMLF
jgi:hypothetical protein